MFNTQIIDAHTHLPVNDNRDLKSSINKLIKDQESFGVRKMILIPDNEEETPIGSLNECLELTKDIPNIYLLGTMDILNADIPKQLTGITMLFDEEKICGLKIFPGHDPIYPTDYRLRSFYKLCIKYNKPLVIHTGWNSEDSDVAKYNDPKYIVKIAKEFPKLKIVISHYFWPKVDYCYNITRGIDNIYFDTSALADEEVVRETGYKNILNILRKTVKDNPESLIYGTDYGMCKIRDHLHLIKDLELDDETLELILYKNAEKVFGLK